MQQQPPVFADASSDEVFETNLQGDEFFESGADDHFFFDAADMNPSENETLGDDDGDDRGETDDISVATNSSALLYDRSQLTVSASSVLVLQFKMKHKLTQEALGDLLELLKLHCPSPNKCFQSVYLFTKQFHELKLPVTFHYFCSSCLRIVKDNDRNCQNTSCSKDLSAPGAMSSFIEVSIEAQLQKLLERMCI